MGEKKIEPAAATKIYDLTDADKLPTIDIPAVEIFSEGVWNGDSYAARDLDDMVAAFSKVGFKPPVKAGHEDGQEDASTAKRLFGEPSLGFVSRIYRKGGKLLADLISVPRVFANLIRSGAYRRISAEIYWNYKDESSGTTYPRVLKAVSFLGAQIPALTGLKEIEALYNKNAAGFLYAKDGAGNEFRLYDRDYAQNVSFGPVSDFLLTSRRKTKDATGYSDDGGDEPCEECKFYIENLHGCTLVEGYIEENGGCELFEAESEDYAAKKKKTKKYMIEKRGDEYCLISKSTGKTLGCHPTREKAQAQEAAIKANMERGDISITAEEMREVCHECADKMAALSFKSLKIGRYDEEGEFHFQVNLPEGTINSLCEKFGAGEGFRTRCMDSPMAAKMDSPGAFCNALKIECGKAASRQPAKAHEKEGGDAMSMTEQEIKDAQQKLADDRKKLADDKKQFEADQEKIAAKAKEDADKVAGEKEKENERLRGRVEQLERENEDEKLAAWMTKQKQDRKIIPVEEARLTAIFKAVRGMPKVVKFSGDDGKEIEQTPDEVLRSLIESRKPHQLFSEFSRHTDEGEQGTYENAGAEVDAKTKAYMKEKNEKEYATAMRAVLKADPALNERYMTLQKQ